MRAHDLIATRDYGTGEIIIQARVSSDDAKRALELADELRGREIDIEIKQHRKRRSLDANAYAWVLIHKIAEAVALPPVAVYRSMIRDVAGNCDAYTMRNEAAERFIQIWQQRGIGWIAEVLAEAKTPGYTHVSAYYGSSSYDSAQMARLIDLLIAECGQLGIEYLPPKEIERMLGRWR